MLQDLGHKVISNPRYFETNMAWTLFCAEEELEGDIIIAYGDIVYSPNVLQSLLDCNEDIALTVDLDWESYWRARNENPLDDAETLKIKNGNIIEIGKKAHTYNDIEGQYIGLIKISKKILNKVVKFYDILDRGASYDGKNFDNMYMTSFIQMIINNLLNVKPTFINGGWIEIDSLDDLKNLEKIDENFNI